MLRPLRPCPWRACALAALVLLGSHQEHNSIADAARIRAAAGDVADRAAANPADSSGAKRPSKGLAVVRDALSDMLTNIKKEETQEVQKFYAFQKWCTTELDGFQKLLDGAVTSREEKSVRQKELEAVISTLENDLVSMKKEEQKTAESLSQEQQMDKEDDKKYDQDITMNSQANSQVTQAIKIVGKVQEQGGFLQNGVLTRLQMNEPGESSYVLGIMRQLRKTLADTRIQLMGSQETQEANSNAMVQTAQAQLQALEKDEAGKRQQLAQARVELAEVKNDLDRALKAIPEAEQRIQETEARCDAKSKAWAVRKKDRIDEQAALKEALGLLSQGDVDPKAMGANASGAVAGSSQPMQAFGSGQSSGAVLPALVQVESSRSRGSSGAGSLAYLSALTEQRGGNDVKQVVKDMAGLLNKQQKDEEALVKQCRASLDSKGDDAVQNQDEIAKLNASINLKDAEILTLSAEAADLKKSLRDLDASLQNATALRKEEKKMYESQSKDRKLSVKVLKQAMQVLKKFYATKDLSGFRQIGSRQAAASALQLGEELVVVDASVDGNSSSPSAPPSTWSGSSRKTIAGAAVTKLLSKLVEDMKSEQATADTEETEAVTAYEKLLKDSKAQFDNTMSEITERMKRKATLTVQLNSDKEDKSEEVEELGTVEGQLQALHRKCDEVLKTIKDRTKARDFELSQLRDVLDILSGSQLAVRTGA